MYINIYVYVHIKVYGCICMYLYIIIDFIPQNQEASSRAVCTRSQDNGKAVCSIARCETGLLGRTLGQQSAGVQHRQGKECRPHYQAYRYSLVLKYIIIDYLKDPS